MISILSVAMIFLSFFEFLNVLPIGTDNVIEVVSYRNLSVPGSTLIDVKC